ncbi:Thymidylate synthase [compost metagenome]
MHIFTGNNLNDTYLNSLQMCLELCSEPSTSRGGDVYDFGPAYFEFLRPIDQLLTLRNRGFNPYFAIIEAAWVLSGNNHLTPLERVISNYSKYSDDGETLNGAYGFRMRRHFGQDQLSQAIETLRGAPNSRRVVITLYSPEDLNNNKSSDIPCNTTIYIKIRSNKLDLTVLNRSNDLFLGIPYNVFVFNCIQKYAAHHLGLEVGIQRHFTDSLHLYKENIEAIEKITQTNDQQEVSNWQEHPTPTSLYSSIINESDSICELKPNNIKCQYTKSILANYLNYKPQNNHIDLVESLPYDTFGLSAKLWLETIYSRAQRPC